MSPTVKGVLCVILGAVFLLLPVIRVLLNQREGKRMLPGEVTGIDQKTKMLHIRCRIAKDTYHEFEWKADSGFLPQPGLKVAVTVYKDDPYKPVSVLTGTKMMRGEPLGYTHGTMRHFIIRCAILGGFFVFCGVLFLTGEIR